MMRSALAIVAASLALTGAAHGQEPVCDSTKPVLGSASNGVWPAAAPSLMFDGAPVTCNRVTDTLISCSLARIEVCANRAPSGEDQAAFRARMQKVYAELAPAMRQCLADRTIASHEKTLNGDGYVRQERGQKFIKAGEPTVRMVDGVTRMISGDYRCETSSASIEFEIE